MRKLWQNTNPTIHTHAPTLTPTVLQRTLQMSQSIPSTPKSLDQPVDASTLFAALVPMTVERPMFTATTFAPPVLVDAVCQRVVGRIPDGASSTSALDVRRENSMVAPPSNAAVDPEPPQEFFQAIAGKLVQSLEQVEDQLNVLLSQEYVQMGVKEAQARYVESSRKGLLNEVRSELEKTTAQIRSFEDGIANALTATVGIEQHLLQSHQRVSRGKAVSTLLKHFQMLTSIPSKEMATILAGLSRAREEQRRKVTDYWMENDVSHLKAQYYTTTKSMMDNDGHEKKRNRRRKRRGQRDDDDDDDDQPDGDGDGDDDGDAAGGAADLDSDDEGDIIGYGGVGVKVPLHRAEMTAVSQGLDRLFASRHYTELQVTWIGKLSVLGRELKEVVGKASNIAAFRQWLRGELRKDCLHLVDRFREFYDANGESVLHVAYGKALLKTLETVGRLYTALLSTTPSASRKEQAFDGGEDGSGAGGSGSLLDDFIERSVSVMVSELQGPTFEVKSVPPQAALQELTMSSLMAFFSKEVQKTIESVEGFISYRITREVILVEALVASGLSGDVSSATVVSRETKSPASTRTRSEDASTSSPYLSALSTSADEAAHRESIHPMASQPARQQLFQAVLDRVLRGYVRESLVSAEATLKSTMDQEAALTPRSKRKSAGRVADAIAYDHSVTAALYALCTRCLDGLRREYGALETNFLQDYLPSIFTSQEAYVSQRRETELLKRYYSQLEEQYMRALLPPVGEPFGYAPEHSMKANDMCNRLDEVVHRVTLLCPPQEVSAYVEDLVRVAIDAIGTYLVAECEKMLASVKEERARWDRERPDSEWESPQNVRETPINSAQMIIFSQSVIHRIHGTITSIAADGFLPQAVLADVTDFTNHPTYVKLDEVCEDLINMVAAGVVTKSLAILNTKFNRNDYTPKAGAEMKCSLACHLFCCYVSHQLRQIEPQLRTSCGQLWASRPSDDSSASNSTINKPRGGVSPSLGPQQAAAANFLAQTTADQDRTLTTLRSRSDAEAKVKRMKLQQLLFGDGGPSSLVRAIGVPLYRGVVAYLKGHYCTETGAVIYKLDVSAFTKCLSPLATQEGLDSMVMDRLLRLLGETSGLLVAAIENIKDVKNSGLLSELMSNEEKIEFLRMRTDLREGFRSL